MATTPKYQLLFIVNPYSGVDSKDSIKALIDQHLDKQHFDYQVIYTEGPKHAISLSKHGVHNKLDAIIAVGGDGSVNEVGQALIHSKTALGIIPMGSGNGLARHLKIPMDTADAIKRINRFERKRIDTATINNEPFLGTAGLGFDAHVGWKFAEFGKRGFFSYMQVTANEFFKFTPDQYQVEIDGERIESNAFLVNFANSSQFGNNAWIAPSAEIDNGLISVCVLEKFPAVMAPDMIFKLFSKRLEKSKYYKVHKGKEIKIHHHRDIAHIDGEPINVEEDLVIKVIPASLDVIC
ncbi:YegS/Rv2252/BmrU family lipid kinase [Vicingaceae bacterium]|nr:YegS/Rv2252/BmrU family lipid kinase [Vicingaceae bacterium]